MVFKLCTGRTSHVFPSNLSQKLNLNQNASSPGRPNLSLHSPCSLPITSNIPIKQLKLMNGPRRAAIGIVKAEQQSASSSSSAVTPEIISVAHELAEAAAAVTAPYFRTAVPVDIKTDTSPVTIADRQAEIAMRAVINSRFPSHAIFGEEQGYTPGTSNKDNNNHSGEYMWVIDPIDGTKSFITGKPLFGTLIALLHNGRPVLGIIDQPILKERWLGVSGKPTTLNNNPISTRLCAEVSSAYMYATTPHMFTGASELAFNRLRDQVRIPLYGCDCYAYGLLAAGHCDLVAEADLKPYDYMALIPVIQGAGGVITDWKGKELCWSTEEAAQGEAPPGEVLAAGDSTCHIKALELLAWK